MSARGRTAACAIGDNSVALSDEMPSLSEGGDQIRAGGARGERA
ncbi:hypothetical protein EPIB1_1546 [Tritonibacter mobilis]|nr:hypothetical protein EPIB1_1546 [Tritonibacter mobilis]